MAAQVCLFSNFSSLNPKPTKVYCDTSFLIDLLYYNENIISNPSRLEPRNIACFDFYNLLVANGVELVTSVYGYSELMHFYFFKYPNGMNDAIKAHVRANSAVYASARRYTLTEKYKFFISRFPIDFETAFNGISHRIDRVEKFLTSLGVTVKYPLPSPRLTNISRNVIEYASLLLESFHTIESNDALHVSIADYLSITDIIALDNSFKSIDDITVYAFN